MKALLIILLLIGAAFGIPSIRNRIVGPLDPLLSKLGPLGEKIATPARRWQVNQDHQLIFRRIAEERSLHRPMPAPRTFQSWLKTNVPGLKWGGNDPWGRPYYFIHNRQTTTVGSEGPDRVRDTSDDLRLTAPSVY